MKSDRLSRTRQLVGETALFKIKNANIIIFGVGGVGGQALESLVRAGFLSFTIVDRDVVEESNLNRQLIATSKTVGLPKVQVAKARMLEVNPAVHINDIYGEITPENIRDFNLSEYDFIVDAIDSFNSKMSLIKHCLQNNLPIISAMGAGNRLDPTKIIQCDIFATTGCPLAKKVRAELRKDGFKSLPVVTSSELPLPNEGTKPGSSPFVPAAAGLAIASYIFTNVIRK